MSLYYDAAKFLELSKDRDGSLKSRVFGTKDLKSSPKQVYAVVAEASKWSPILTEVIENSQLLLHERKLTPSLALLLAHDLLLSKSGIAAPATHPLRLAVTRHKARLGAELTQFRIRKGFGSIEQLRIQIENTDVYHAEDNISNGNSSVPKTKPMQHPRWVRINTVKTTLEAQLKTTFAECDKVDSLEQVLVAKPSTKILHVDEHVPNLIVLPIGTDLAKTAAYRKGLIILQDKASCFPAYLLDADPENGACLDACAAPGNKTTHLAAIFGDRRRNNRSSQIWACERDKARAEILTRMVMLAGCQDIVKVKAGQDFLLLNPEQAPWNEVGSLLLDPSCSGSGIIGRDKNHAVTLPTSVSKAHMPKGSRKRKRRRHGKIYTHPVANTDISEEVQQIAQADEGYDRLPERLEALSAFQIRLLTHAFRFPNAHRISYSTCSMHAEENEHVVIAALQSHEAKQYGWQLLRRQLQVEGMKSWSIRGDLEACHGKVEDGSVGADQVAEACIRCRPGTEEGTQGFFVAGFVRRSEGFASNEVGTGTHSDDLLDIAGLNEDSYGSDGDWNGLSDND
ncbi:MAG: hypothetical protein Q9209_003761 [Squamulea sp. 1 TL-2023]